MRHNEHSFEEAFDFVKARRSCISLNMSFREALTHYSPRTVGSSLMAEMSKAELRQFQHQHENGAEDDDEALAAHDGLAPPNMSVFSDDECVSSNTARTATGSSNVSQQDQHHHHHQPLMFYTPPHPVVVAQVLATMHNQHSAYTELEEESGA